MFILIIPSKYSNWNINTSKLIITFFCVVYSIVVKIMRLYIYTRPAYICMPTNYGAKIKLKTSAYLCNSHAPWHLVGISFVLNSNLRPYRLWGFHDGLIIDLWVVSKIIRNKKNKRVKVTKRAYIDLINPIVLCICINHRTRRIYH